MPGATGAKVATPAPPVPKSGDVSNPGRALVAKGPAAKDPRFAGLLAQVQRNAKRQKNHPSAAQKAAEAQRAAKPPANEKTAGAKANSVDAMQEAKAEKPKTNGFLEMLRAEIEKVMPKTLDDTQHFMAGGEKDGVKNAVKGGVSESKAEATGPTEEAAAAPPDTGAVPTRAPTDAPADPAQPTEALDARNAVPVPKTNAAISQEKKSQDADAQMKEAEVTDTQLKKANDPRFSAVSDAKTDVKAKVAAAPGQYRQGEKAALAVGVAGANAVGRVGVGAMVQGRGRGGTQVKTRQQLARERDEKRRKAVTDKIESIFQRTKDKVDAKLSTLETDVMAIFDAGMNLALADMKSWSDLQIDKFKDDRYSGLIGKGRWIADLFKPCPEGIKAILRQAKTRFSATMDALAVKISGLVDARLAAAKAEIVRGQQEVASYVSTLPADLKSVGKAAQDEVQGRFKELEDGIESKKQELAASLAQKFKEANDKADEELKRIEEANAGALKKFADKLAAIIKVIAEFKNKLMAALRKGWETIKLILADPIGFLGNLISAVKGGIAAFVANFAKHLLNGLAKWLFGNLASAGITMPTDLSLMSIFKLVMELLGLTYANIRARAVKLVGEPVVKAVETMAEFIQVFIRGGPAALWAHIKEQLSDLKSMVLDAIISWVTTTIITQATTKIISMFNPAGAFIQACIAIYNIVMFIIERAQQILAFIEAVINSVHAIATGSIGGAIKWIENALAATIPLVISFFARLIGLGGITAKIVSIVKAVQAKINKGIDWVLGKIIGGLKKLIRGVVGGVRRGAAAVAGFVLRITRPRTFSGGGESHRIWADESGRVMVASTPTPVSAQLGAWRREAIRLPEPKKSQANGLIATAQPIAAQAETAAIAVFRAKRGRDDATATAEQTKVEAAWGQLIPILSQLVTLTGKGPFDPPFQVSPFVAWTAKVPAGTSVAYMREFYRQVRDHQTTINAMDVKKWRDNRGSYEVRRAGRIGRPKESHDAQKDRKEVTREKIVANVVASLTRRGWTPAAAQVEAEKRATEQLRGRHATHNADIVSGGDPTEIARMGLGYANSHIGSQWEMKRPELLRLTTVAATFADSAKMNIVLTVVEG